MLFNATDKSGTADPIEVTDVFQFLPSVGGQIAVGITSIFTDLIKPAIKTGFDGVYVASKGTQTASKLAIPSSIKSGIGSIGTKAAVTSGFTFGSLAILSGTTGGQNIVGVAGDSLNLGKQITDFFNKNPIVPIGLIALGGLLLVSVIKK